MSQKEENNSNPKTDSEMIRDLWDAMCGSRLHKEGYFERVDRIDKIVERHTIYWGIAIGVGTIIFLIAAFWGDINKSI